MKNPLLEEITPEYIQSIESDIRTFLKNVNRLKEPNDFWELWDYWSYWKKEVFGTFIKKYGGKGLGVYDPILKDTITGKLINRLSKSIDGLFLVDDTDLKKYLTKTNNNNKVVVVNQETGRGYNIQDLIEGINNSYKYYSMKEEDFPGVASIEKLLDSWTGGFVEEAKGKYFEVWQFNANSRYISTKKIVDETFEDIMFYSNTTKDKFIEERTEYLDIPITLFYEEEGEDEIYQAYKSVENALDQLNRKGVLKYVSNVEIQIDFIEKNVNREFFVKYDKRKSKAGGTYSFRKIVLYKTDTVDTLIVLLHEFGHAYFFEHLTRQEQKRFEEFYVELTTPKEEISNERIDDLNVLYKEVQKKNKEYKKEVLDVLENPSYTKKEIPSNEIADFKKWKTQDTFGMEDYIAFLFDFLKTYQKGSLFIYLSQNTSLSFIEKEIILQLSRETDYRIQNYDGTLQASTYETIEFYLDVFYKLLIAILKDIKKNNKIDYSRIPSKYSSQNSGELFAEMFAYYFGFNMPFTGLAWLNRFPNAVKDDIMYTFKSLAGLREQKKKKDNYILMEKESIYQWAFNNYSQNTLPKGYVVHGRRTKKDLNTGWVIQGSYSWEVAKQYAGNQGTIWLIRPNNDANILKEKDIKAFCAWLYKELLKGEYPEIRNSYERGNAFEELNKEDVLADLLDNYNPKDIVCSAQAYDNIDWQDPLYDYGIDFVYTENGAVVLDLDKIEGIQVPLSQEDVSVFEERFKGKPLYEDLSLKQVRQKAFYSGKGNKHLQKFYRQRIGIMGSPNTLVKLIETKFDINKGSMLFRFLTEATPLDDPKYELRDKANYNAGTNSAYGYGHLMKNPSELYTMELLIDDFYDLLEAFVSSDTEYTKEYLNDIINASLHVKMSCSCPGHLLQGGMYYLTVDGAAIRTCNIAPQRWNLIRPDVHVCKHLQNLLTPQVLGMLLQQMAQKSKAELQKYELIGKKE